MGALDGATILANARAAAPVLREEATPSEDARRLTPRAVDALRVAGAFRMTMPRAWGGPEVDVCTQLEILEELAAADGSAGWCAMIGSDGGFLTAALDDEVGRALYPDLDAVTAAVIQPPSGALDVVDGGYRLSGRWPFASGCTHADVVAVSALVFRDGDMVTHAEGVPELRIAMLPAERFEVLDTWYTTGLAGSGSHDVTIEAAFVPAEQTFGFEHLSGRRDGPLYAWPGLFTQNLAGVPLGIGRAALEWAVGSLADKVLMPEMRKARNDARVRTAVARAHALVGSARSYTFDVFGEFWASLEAGDEPSLRQRAAVGGCPGHVTRSCRDAVELLAEAVGTASIRRDSPLERHRRDILTVGQHIFNQARFLEMTGGLWFDGADTDHPLLATRMI